MTDGPTISPYVPAYFYTPDGQLKDGYTNDEVNYLSNVVKTEVDKLPPGGKEIYLTLLNSSPEVMEALTPELTQQQFNDAVNGLSSKLDELQTQAANLTENASEFLTLLLSVLQETTSTLLAKLAVEETGNARQAALADRLNKLQASITALFQQASQQTQAAADQASGAMMGLVLGIMGGLIGAVTAAGLYTRSGSLSTASATGGSAFDYKHTIFNTVSTAGQTGQTVMNTTGQVGNQLYQSNATTHEAAGTEQSAEAQYNTSMSDTAKSNQEALTQLMEAIINFVKSILDAQVEGLKAATEVGRR